MLVLFDRINKLSYEHNAAWTLKIVEGSQTWKPPPKPYVKINTDVDMRDGFAVAAGVFRDSRGQVLGQD